MYCEIAYKPEPSCVTMSHLPPNPRHATPLFPVEHASNELGDRHEGLGLVLGLWQKQHESKGDTSTRGRSDNLESLLTIPYTHKSQFSIFLLVPKSGKRSNCFQSSAQKPAPW